MNTTVNWFCSSKFPLAFKRDGPNQYQQSWLVYFHVHLWHLEEGRTRRMLASVMCSLETKEVYFVWKHAQPAVIACAIINIIQSLIMSVRLAKPVAITIKKGKKVNFHRSPGLVFGWWEVVKTLIWFHLFGGELKHIRFILWWGIQHTFKAPSMLLSLPPEAMLFSVAVWCFSVCFESHRIAWLPQYRFLRCYPLQVIEGSLELDCPMSWISLKKSEWSCLPRQSSVELTELVHRANKWSYLGTWSMLLHMRPQQEANQPAGVD